MTIFKNITEPGRIGSITLKNRMIMTAMGLNTSTAEGLLTDEEIEYYRARAEGGVAMITIGCVSISHPDILVAPREVSLDTEEHIQQMRKLAAVLHRNDCKLCIQLHHGGYICTAESGRHGYPVYIPSETEDHPSEVGTFNELGPDMMLLDSNADSEKLPVINYKVCDKEDLARFVRQFADLAERCVKADVDCVEIHGGHGYLLHTFLNPRYNKRTDEYGGSLENRTRLFVEILQAVRERVGDKLAILCKIDGNEFEVTEEDGDGITSNQAVATAKLLERAGADGISVTGYAPSYKVTCPTSSHIAYEPNILVPYAKRIKEAVSIPVTCVGNISIPDADNFISEGDFDFLQIGRKLLADPELPKKVIEDRYDEARLCLNCYVCVSQMYMGKSVMCAINADCCHEYEGTPGRAKRPKRVLVVGGGPAGMEAACVLAERGHEVTIADKSDKLGGTLFFASVCTPSDYHIVSYLSKRLNDLGVNVVLNTMVDKAFIDGFKPDTVVLATGSKRELPDIPGAKQRHVMDGDTSRDMITGAKSKRDTGVFNKFMCTCGRTLGMLSTPEKVRSNSRIWMPIGKNVVIYGGEIVGLEMAEFLYQRGRKPIVLEPGTYVGEGLAIVRRWKLLSNMRKQGIPVKVKCEAVNIGKNTFTYRDADGLEETIPADTVIIAVGAVPNNDLAKQLAGSDYEVYSIGDCNSKLSFIDGAIHEAHDVAHAI